MRQKHVQVYQEGGSMKVGDIVLCGTGKTVGMVVGFDRQGDPVVYEPKSGITAAMYRDRIEVVNESR